MWRGGVKTQADSGLLDRDSRVHTTDVFKARTGTVGQTSTPRRTQAKGMATIHPLESVAFGPAMGEGCEDQEAGHEPECAGLQGVSHQREMKSLQGLTRAIKDNT